MKIGAITFTLAFSMGFAFLVLAGMPPASEAGPCPSTLDGDSIGDCVDNCTLQDNDLQIDSNGDGYGNVCDGDFDQSGGVDFGDLGVLLGYIGSPVPPTSPDIDMDEISGIGFADLGLLKGNIGSPVGPSACAGGGPGPPGGC